MRRPLLAALLLATSACSIVPVRPYREHVQWPLTLSASTAQAPPPVATHAPALLVRDLSAAPGLETRGLQTLRPDGSLTVDPYQEWAVAPAQGATQALREKLAATGRFAAVLAPGSRAAAGLILEGTLTALIAEPGQARASLTLLLIDHRAAIDRLPLQRVFTATAPLAGDTPEARVAALRTALGAALDHALAAITQALSGSA